jgi:hypothetical protein
MRLIPHHIECKDVNRRARFGINNNIPFMLHLLLLHTSCQEATRTYSCKYVAVARYYSRNDDDGCLSNQSQSDYSFFFHLFIRLLSCQFPWGVLNNFKSKRRSWKWGNKRKGKGAGCICVLPHNLSLYGQAGGVSVPVWLWIAFPSVTFTTPAIPG